jgi:tripartite-type tricarboxylate transporter receptor subunit TctC
MTTVAKAALTDPAHAERARSDTGSMRRRALACVVAAGVALGVPTPSHAQAQAQDPFPSRPIRIVVGFVAGGVSDVLARLVAPELQKALGQPVIVENRPGASGVIAAGQVAKSPPDGYTLYMAPNTHLINSAINPSVPYHAVKDFTPITLLTTTPNMLVVKDDSPMRSVGDLVAVAKAKPGELSYATSGIGTTVHFAGELFAYQAGIKLNHVPFKGANQSIEAVVGGHVPVSVSAVSSTLGFVKSGRVRVLAVMSEKRSALLPDVPTFRELGYKELLSDTWLGLLAPAGLPPAVAKRLNDELIRILQQPEFRERVLTTGNEPVGVGLDAFAAQMSRELDGFIALAKTADIKPQ